MKTKDKGQVMLLTVVMLSGAILAATSLAGLIVLYQFRQTSDTANSTQAIYAADSGVECVFYQKFVPLSERRTRAQLRNCDNGSIINLDNGSSYKITNTGGEVFKSAGRSRRTTRAFEVQF